MSVYKGSIFTASIRRMREGNIFTLCVSPCLDRRRYPSQVLMVGGRVPQPGLDVSGTLGYPPGQVWMVGVPPPPGLDGGGYPGLPPHDWMGYPPPYLDGVPPTIAGWGTPHDWMGYPPSPV